MSNSINMNGYAEASHVKHFLCIANSTSDLPKGEKFDIAYVFSGSLKKKIYVHDGSSWILQN